MMLRCDRNILMS